MTFLVVLGGVAGVVAGVAAMVVGVWACLAKPVKYQIITKKAKSLLNSLKWIRKNKPKKNPSFNTLGP